MVQMEKKNKIQNKVNVLRQCGGIVQSGQQCAIPITSSDQKQLISLRVNRALNSNDPA